jgi:hypothetical protein
VTPLAALVRIGKTGSSVDNWCAGGSLVGIDIATGKCNKWRLTNDYDRQSKLPNGLDLEENEIIIPNFDLIKEQLTKAHYRIPYIKMISWDIALDEENTPVFIECNYAGMIQIHEATTGPLFGELMDKLLDKYLLDEFYTRFCEKNFICREYYNHIVIESYLGNKKRKPVEVPAEFRGKPVKGAIKKTLGNAADYLLPEECKLR